MKLKIQREEGETKSYNLINHWNEIDLEKWAQLISIKTDSPAKEAIQTINALSDIPTKVVKELGIADVSSILSRIAKMQSKTNSKLTKVIMIDGIEYGFHPNLDDITIGEYADIETLVKNDLASALPDLMAILFRPIVEKKNNIYSIQAYDGDITIRREVMKSMSGEQVQNAMVFFWTLGKELLTIMPLYLMEQTRKTLKSRLTNPLGRDGVGLV
tara:strand:+ start:2987 stop:3631 length:645 start_codon:yes stop_codon:yes gene_type:complete